MPKLTSISLFFGDGEHNFLLDWARMLELETAVGCGPMELAKRLTNGEFKIDDIAETVRLGLIGGGMAPAEAYSLTKIYVKERPLTENLELAMQVLSVALWGEK